MILILRYLVGDVDEKQTITDFNLINNSSNLNWSFKSQVTKFIKRFLKDPYRSEDTEWIRNLAVTKGFSSELLRLIEVGASCFNHYCVGYDDT